MWGQIHVNLIFKNVTFLIAKSFDLLIPAPLFAALNFVLDMFAEKAAFMTFKIHPRDHE